MQQLWRLLLMSLDSTAQHPVLRATLQQLLLRRRSIGERCYCVSAWMTPGRTMLTRCSRQPSLSSCRRPCFVDVLHSVYCCCCCDISASLLLFTIALCLSFVTSLAVVTDATTPRTPGNRHTSADLSAFLSVRDGGKITPKVPKNEQS